MYACKYESIQDNGNQLVFLNAAVVLSSNLKEKNHVLEKHQTIV